MEIKTVSFLNSCAKIERTPVVPLPANNRPWASCTSAQAKASSAPTWSRKHDDLRAPWKRSAGTRKRQHVPLTGSEYASEDARHRRRADAQCENGSKFRGTGTFIRRIFFGTFPSFFLNTKHQLRNADTFPRLRDTLPSEQKQHPWTAASHCNPGALGVLFYSCSVCSCTFGQVCVCDNQI